MQEDIRKPIVLTQFICIVAIAPPFCLIVYGFLFWLLAQPLGVLAALFFVKKYPKLYQFKNRYVFTQLILVFLGVCFMLFPEHQQGIKVTAILFVIALIIFTFSKVAKILIDYMSKK